MGRTSEDVLTDPPPPAADVRLAYGREPKQFGDLRLSTVDRPRPLAIVVHGGSWKSLYNLIHAGHLCVALGEAGIATWNVEYRCVGDPGGAWPGAGDDVAAAVEFVDELVDRYPLDPEQIVLVGHSRGHRERPAILRGDGHAERKLPVRRGSLRAAGRVREHVVLPLHHLQEAL